jgi:glycosyltransferase involved in cell wall biosynthesis
LPHRELLGLYRRGEVDVVVLPSLDLGGGEHEGISVAAIEPMGWGLPVVSTSTGGMPELLERGAGVLVAPADGAALADALASLVQSPERRAELGRAARQRILEEYDVRLIAAELARRFADRTGDPGGPVAGTGAPPVAVAAGARGADPWAKSSRAVMAPAEPEDA